MNDLAHAATHIAIPFGESLLSWCLATNLSTLALLLIAAIADVALARRVQAAWRLCLYLPVLLRVIIPAGASLTLPVLTPMPIAQPVQTNRAISLSLTPDTRPAPPETSVSRSLPHAAFGVAYLVGLGLLLAKWTRHIRHVSRVLKGSTPSNEPGVFISPHAGPMVAGVLHPKIIVPRWLIGEQTLSLVMAHERAHVSRRDPVLALIMRLVCTFAWPIVPVWIVASRVRALMEQACDERALRTHGARRQEDIMSYANALIDVAARSSRRAWTLAFGGSLAARILALRNERHWRSAPQAALVASIATILVGCSVVKPGPARVAQPEPATTVTSNATPGEPVASGTASVDPAQAASREHNSGNWGLRVAPEDVVQPLFMLPAQEQFLVNVRIMDGDLPIDWPESGDSIAMIDRQSLQVAIDAAASSRVIAWPRITVGVSEPAEVRMTWDKVEFAFNVVVYPSTPGTVTASVSYTEGTQYQLAAHTLKSKESEASIIRIPAASADGASRTLVITIERPTDDC